MKSAGLVQSTAEIEENIATIARYADGSSAEKEFHSGRLKNGKNYVARQANVGWQFAPSKFAGYSQNDTSHMDKLDRRDGRITNRRITELLGLPLKAGDVGYDEVDEAYIEYAKVNGFVPSCHHRGRKYWLLRG